MSSERLLASGERFGDRYTIEEMVGRGGFSQVFRATTSDGTTVAVKVLLPQGEAGEYPDSLVDRFVREARLLERLRDPFTINLYDHGRSPTGHFYMVFEFLQGRELFDIIKNDGKQSHVRTAHVIRQALKALKSAHALGILHRDIKPNNIMLVREPDGKERIKVLDFGIAKLFGDAAQVAGNDLTAAGVLVGTPRYMSPEQLRANQLGPSSDIYSLGIVAIEMLTGRKAIRGKDRVDIIQQQLSATKFEIPADISCPPELRNIILRMVEKNVHARYQSAAQVLRDLDAWQVTATEGRTIVEVVTAAELHAPRAETAAADEDTNVHRISVAALDSIDAGRPASSLDSTISEAQIETHSQPSLNARLTGGHPSGQHPSGQHPSARQQSGQYQSGQHPSARQPSGQHPQGRRGDHLGRANSESFDRVDTGPGLAPPRTDVSGDLDSTLAHNPLAQASQISPDSMETMESDAFQRFEDPACQPGEFPVATDDQATREHDARSREELLLAAREAGYRPPGQNGASVAPAPELSDYDLPATSPSASTLASSDQPEDALQSKSSDSIELENRELVAILISIPLPGVGHILLDQRARGAVIFAGLFLSLGGLYLVALAVAFDAFLVVRASRQREVGTWEFFPGIGDLLK